LGSVPHASSPEALEPRRSAARPPFQGSSPSSALTMAMLSRAIAGALVLTGGATAASPPKVEVVVAHYNEDLAWLSEYEKAGVNFRVYSKGKVHAGAMALKNVGRESQTYLKHIVDNYDRLADWTVFTQGAAPKWGYRGGDSSSGHLTDNITFADYLTPFAKGRDSFLALSTAVRMPEGMQSTRVGILTKKLRSMSNDKCPAGGANGWTAWWSDPSHPHAKAGKQMLSFYHQHILQNGVLPAEMKPVTLAFVQGARFAVSAKRILARPVVYYRNLLRLLSQERDPLAGYFVEAMWHDIFHPEAPQEKRALCELMPFPASKPMTTKEMYEDTARRLNDLGLAEAVVVARGLSDAYEIPPETTDAPTVEETTVVMETTAEPVMVITTEEPVMPIIEETTGMPLTEATTEAPPEPQEAVTVSGSSEVGCASPEDCEKVCSNHAVFCSTLLETTLAGVDDSVGDAAQCDAGCADRRRLQDAAASSVNMEYDIKLPTAALESSGTSLDVASLVAQIKSNVDSIDTNTFAAALTQALQAANVTIEPLTVKSFTVTVNVEGGDSDDDDGDDDEESAAFTRSAFGSSAAAFLAAVSAYIARQG